MSDRWSILITSERLTNSLMGVPVIDTRVEVAQKKQATATLKFGH